MSDGKRQGRFVWYDLMTSDPEAAINFYTRVAGWGTVPWQGDMPYTMWTNNSKPIGGVMAMPAGSALPAHWIGYISTPDIEATVKQAAKLGAFLVVPPTNIPDVGRFAILHDPQGATFALYTSAKQQEQPGKPEVGEFSWRELRTREQPAAFRFYQTLFGWDQLRAFDIGPMGSYQEFGADGIELGGMFNKPDEMPGLPLWVYYIFVSSLQKALDGCSGNGGKVLSDPMEVPGGDWVAQCMDPQGGVFALHSKTKG